MEPPDSLETSLSLLGELLGEGQRDAAWEGFVARYGPLIRWWCRRHDLQPADADDVVAVVLQRLVTGIHTYRRVAGDTIQPFRPWLRGVVENAVRDQFRDRRRHPGDRGTGDSAALHRLGELKARPGGDLSVEDLVQEISDHLDDDYVKAFRAVQARRGGTKSWQAYELLCLRGGTVAETAAALSMTPAAVSTAAYRVKSELNNEYEARVCGAVPEGPRS